MRLTRILLNSTSRAGYLDRQRHHVLDKMLRVNHAGELGADRIYCGQSYILSKDREHAPVIQKMWDQEKAHLEELEYLNLRHRTRKSILEPFWSLGGFVMGSASALMGPKAAMACTVAVEKVITEHYNDQIRDILAEEDLKNPDTKEILDKFSQFRDDEQGHHDEGLAHDAQSTPYYDTFTKAIELVYGATNRWGVACDCLPAVKQTNCRNSNLYFDIVEDSFYLDKLLSLNQIFISILTIKLMESHQINSQKNPISSSCNNGDHVDEEGEGDEEEDEDNSKSSFDRKLYSCGTLDPTFELFILSEAGKPIYSYTRRDDIITLMPVCQALMNVACSSQEDTLHSITSSSRVRISFASRSPLIIVVISKINSSVEPRAVIGQVEAQIASILTLKSLRTVFEQRSTFDLKRLLLGSEKLIDATIHLTVSILNYQQRRALPPPNLVGHHYQETSSRVTSNNSCNNSQLVENNNEEAKNYMTAQSEYLYQHQAENQWPWSQAFLCCGNTSNPKLISTSQPELNRILTPVVIMSSNNRDQFHSAITSSVSSNSTSIIFTILFKVIGKKSSDIDTDVGGVESASRPSSQQNNSENIIATTTTTSENNSNQSAGIQQEQASISSRNNQSPLVESIKFSENSNMDNIRFELITIVNHHSGHKISPLDTQLLLALLNGSKSQLFSMESLWMPVCLPRFNSTAFLHSHISYIRNFEFCLIMLTIDRDEFSNCQTIKLSIEDKLNKLISKFESKSLSSSSSNDTHTSMGLSPLLTVCIGQQQSTPLTAHQSLINLKDVIKGGELLSVRQLQFLWYQTQRQVLMWQQTPRWTLSPLVYYVARRMSQSRMKTFWLRSENDKVILGWHVSTFQLYAQFDATITPSQALEAIQVITNWIKKEEDNFSLKDYK